MFSVDAVVNVATRGLTCDCSRLICSHNSSRWLFFWVYCAELHCKARSTTLDVNNNAVVSILLHLSSHLSPSLGYWSSVIWSLVIHKGDVYSTHY